MVAAWSGRMRLGLSLGLHLVWLQRLGLDPAFSSGLAGISGAGPPTFVWAGWCFWVWARVSSGPGRLFWLFFLLGWPAFLDLARNIWTNCIPWHIHGARARGAVRHCRLRAGMGRRGHQLALDELAMPHGE